MVAGGFPGSLPMPNSGIMPNANAAQAAMPVLPAPATEAVTGMGGNVQANNPFNQLMKALFDPKGAAQDMAKAGVTPEEFASQVKTDNLAKTMAQTTANAPPPTEFGVGGNSKLGRTLHGADTPSATPSITDLMTPKNIIQSDPNDPNVMPATADKFITLSDVMNSVAPGGMGGGRPQIGGGTGANPASAAAVNPTAKAPGLTGMPPMARGGMMNNMNSFGQWLSGLFGGGSTGEGLSGVPPMFGQGQGPAAVPVVPPVSPTSILPGNGQPTMPIAPPVAPPPSATNPTVAGAVDDYASGKIKSSVMGGSGGNAPDSQLKGNSIFNEFMGTIKAGGVTNPNALAAIAATTKSESGFSEKNFYGSWNDPSQSGVAGKSGGAMSWRNERFQAMKDFVKANGGDPSKPSAALQAKFFLQEDPSLIAKLNAAKTPEEAQQLMNNAWKFAGYDNPSGGEAARRIALARNFASSGNFGDLSGIIPAANGGTVAGAGGTGPVAGTSLTDRLAAAASGLTDPGNGSAASQDLNLPSAPSPVAPRPGAYSPDANVQKLMLMLLTGLSGGGANIPTLTQLMQGRGASANG